MSVGNSKQKLGYSEYCGFPDDGGRHEIIDGDHCVNPAPSTYHQRVSVNLCYQLYSKIKSTGMGEVFSAPIDLQLGDHDIVQPDLLVILDHKKSIITPTKISGVPDLVVEILSPSTAENDRKLKKELYRRSAVPEYWIVDPDDHQLEQWVLNNDAYRKIDHDGATIRLHVVEHATIDATKIW